MATTTNYSWVTPDDTALVKDGAAAIRTLGSSIDTTTKALNPSTTLGDIEYRSATANTNTRLGLGTAGQVLKVNSGATAPEWGAISASPTSATDFVTTSQSTSSTSFTGLTTAQTITMTTGTKVLVLLTAALDSGSASAVGNISVNVSGATTRSSTIQDCQMMAGANQPADPFITFTTHVYLTCTAGSNTFTMQFRTDGSTINYQNRRMTVIDLGS
jgi:hypothetical protein